MPQPSPRSWKNTRIASKKSISGWSELGEDGQGLRSVTQGVRRAVAEQRLGRDRVVAAVAERVAAQQPPAGQHGAAQYAVALDRLHRVVRAGRVVLAAARQRRRDHALVERGSGRARCGARAGSLRLSPARRRAAHAVDELGQRAAHAAACPRARPGPSRPGARRRRSPSRRAGARPPARTPRAARASRACGRRRRRRGATRTARAADPSSGALLARERVEHQEPVGLRAALPVDALELGAARQPARRLPPRPDISPAARRRAGPH